MEYIHIMGNISYIYMPQYYYLLISVNCAIEYFKVIFCRKKKKK